MLRKQSPVTFRAPESPASSQLKGRRSKTIKVPYNQEKATQRELENILQYDMGNRAHEMYRRVSSNRFCTASPDDEAVLEELNQRMKENSLYNVTSSDRNSLDISSRNDNLIFQFEQ